MIGVMVVKSLGFQSMVKDITSTKKCIYIEVYSTVIFPHSDLAPYLAVAVVSDETAAGGGGVASGWRLLTGGSSPRRGGASGIDSRAPFCAQ